MATFLDVGLFQYFQVIFPVLIVFALVYAVLQKTKALGDNAGVINAIVAIVAGFMILLSKTALSLINFMTPWFVVLIVFFLLFLLVFRVFGASDSMVANALKDKTLMWALIGIGLLIFLIGIGNTVGQSLTEKAFQETETEVAVGEGSTATTSYEDNIMGIIFNTKVLGLLLIMFIAVFAIAFLTGSTAP